MKIPRQKVRLIALTANYKIVGDAYLPIQARLSDFMNSHVEHKFIPVTDAKIYDISNKSLFMEFKFATINIEEVVLASTESESVQDEIDV